MARWTHEHNFVDDHSSAEKKTHRVILLTATMMIVEIIAGSIFNSMALLADGWHMSTHVAAFMIAAAAYRLARRYAKDSRFTFGTGKIAVLGGFASAVVLAMVALIMAGESIQRMLNPVPIRFNEAIPVAVLGLVVNLVCAWLLKDDPHHHHQHHHDHDHESHGDGRTGGGPRRHHHRDLNLRAAYLHVIADAFTSVTAITALIAGKYMGWVWMDALMGILGSIVISVWAYGLLRDTSGVLLDKMPDSSLAAEIREGIEAHPNTVVTDLHVWQVGINKFAAIVSVVASEPKQPHVYRESLKEHEELVHVTIEVEKHS